MSRATDRGSSLAGSFFVGADLQSASSRSSAEASRLSSDAGLMSIRHRHKLYPVSRMRRMTAVCDVCRKMGACEFCCSACDWDICCSCLADESRETAYRGSTKAFVASTAPSASSQRSTSISPGSPVGFGSGLGSGSGSTSGPKPAGAQTLTGQSSPTSRGVETSGVLPPKSGRVQITKFLSEYSTKELKQLLESRGGNPARCFEKRDVEEALQPLLTEEERLVQRDAVASGQLLSRASHEDAATDLAASVSAAAQTEFHFDCLADCCAELDILELHRMPAIGTSLSISCC